jgi:hypothetical protein
MYAKMNALERCFRVLGVLEITGGIILSLVSFAGVLEAGPFGQVIGYSLPFIWLGGGIIFGMLFFAVANGLYYLRNIMGNSAQLQILQNKSEAVQAIDFAAKPSEAQPSVETVASTSHRNCKQCGGTVPGTQAWRGPNQWVVRCSNCRAETEECKTEALAWPEWDEKNKN